ncbi:MAG: DUF2628 domain-containing protein [Oscillospiraceae bacterium]|nr:DUF2628 domain-containing protein [Oscillospiraceae bacterium]
MTNYLGVKCPVCDKKFEQDDDIVVCPVCGAPHHRACYAKTNECAFIKDHMSGNVWRAPHEPEPENRADGPTKKCPNCDADIPADALFCHICGQNLHAAQARQRAREESNAGWGIPGMDFIGDPLYTVYGGVDPDEEIDGESVRDVAAYVGNSSSYYVPRFKEMSERGRTISPNFAALFFNFFFYFYRKMYLVGVIMLALYIVSSIPNLLYTKEMMPLVLNQMEQMGFGPMFEQIGLAVPSMDMIDLDVANHYLNLNYITRFINFAIGAVLSMCCNRIYYEKSVKAVRRIRQSAQQGAADQKPAQDSYRGILMRVGGTSKIAVLVVGLGIAVAYFSYQTALLYLFIGG